jgi:hypothetical protein
MTYCSTYIADLNDPNFDPNVFAVGNLPRQLAPSFPSVWEHYNAPFHRWVKERQIPTRVIDHSAFLAIVTKAQIEDYIALTYGNRPGYNDPKEMANHKTDVSTLNAIKAVVTTFDDHKLYGLVAECD